MNKYIVTIFVALAAFTLGAEEDNLLQNPEFKIDSKTERIACWYVKSGKVANSGPDGKPALAFKIERKATWAKTDYYTETLVQYLKGITPGEYEVSILFRGNPFAVNMQFRVSDKSGKEQAVYKKIQLLRDCVKYDKAPDWYRLFGKFQVKENTDKLIFIFQGESQLPVTMEICDPQLVKVDE